MPDVRLLAPLVANICAPSDPHFPGAYFDILSLGVLTKSLGRTEFGPNFDPAGKPGHPPLKVQAVFVWKISTYPEPWKTVWKSTG